MSRVMTWALLCAMLCGLAGAAMAQQIFVGGDPATMKMDVYLRDADLPEVLAALFNSTDDKYQLRLGEGVVGRIARLQFTATPFEEALDTILGPEYSYTKTKRENGTTLYTIAGRNSGAARPTGGMVMNAPPADDPITPSASNLGTGAPAKTTGAGFPSLTYFTKPTTSTTGTTATGTPGTTTTEAATEELAVVKMIGINYLDLESICDALGGTSIALFNQGNYGGGTSGTGGTRSNRYNDNYNDPYYNNNNNSNNYNNNNYNDNYNTRNTRTTNTRNTRTSNRNYDY